jgi:hypothetical protein
MRRAEEFAWTIGLSGEKERRGSGSMEEFSGKEGDAYT